MGITLLASFFTTGPLPRYMLPACGGKMQKP